MKRPNFPNFLGHFLQPFLRDIFRNRADHGYPFCGNPFWPLPKLIPKTIQSVSVSVIETEFYLSML